MDRTCENCRFYCKDYLECRKNPPIITDRSCNSGVFPVILPSDWCGQFERPLGAVKKPPTYRDRLSDAILSKKHLEVLKNAI